MPVKPQAYEGSEPYVFVSYAHKDSGQVFPVLNELQERGYRFWYDDGIAPGSEWPEDIARHLDGAAAVIAFVTPRSMASNNCRREINFSLSRNKPFLSILLEQTKMSLGMEMQLSAQQSILRYNYATWDDFIAKILACPAIEPCKVESEPEPEPLAAPEPEPVPLPAVEPVSAPVTPAVVAAPQSAPEPEPAPAAPSEPELTAVREAPVTPTLEAATPVAADGDAESAAPTPKKKLPLIGIAVAAVIIAVAALAFTLGGQFKTSWGETFKWNGQVVNVQGQTLEQSDLEHFAKMESLRSLNLSECDLSACDFSQVTFASPVLSEVWITSAKGVNDYAFLENMELSRLYVDGCADFDDAALSHVNPQSLSILDVSGTAVTDLSALVAGGEDGQELRLMTLSFEDTKVKDLSPLEQMPKLATVEGSRSEVTSLDALAPLTELRELYFDGCAISKVSQAFGSLRLDTLSLAGSGVTNLSGLADCTTLTELDLSDNPKLTSMDWLDYQNYTTLKKLNLARTGLTSDSLAWVAECTELTDLWLDGVPLTDLSCVDGLKGLERFSAINCGLEDISGLSKASNLQTILLSFNKIADVSALSGLALESRVTLDLTNNALKSVAELPVGEYLAIMLYGNDASVAATLPEGIDAFEVTTAYFDGMRTEALKNVTYDLYVVGCPQNQVVKMQEFFGSGVNLVTEDELWELYATDGFAYSLGDMSSFSNTATGTSESTGLPSVAPTISYDEEVGS